MMKLNCDMAEGFGSWSMGLDNEVMPYIDMANIACGFHASDPFIMSKTVAMAKENGVSIGAHPGYPDLLGFGRRDIAFSLQEITDLIQYQVGALQAICAAKELSVDYVKPHGALYNLMMRDEAVLLTIIKAVAAISREKDQDLSLMVLANAQADTIKTTAKEYDVSILFEAFCDRAYNDDGSLVSRGVEGAVLADDESIEKRIQELIVDKEITCLSGKKLPIHADTVCVHGDNAHALATVKKIRDYINRL